MLPSNPVKIRLNALLSLFLLLPQIRVALVTGVADPAPLQTKLREKTATYPGKIDLVQNQKGRWDLVNELPLETYLIGLLHGEMHRDWPIEALKAQAVAARTYALRQQKRRGKKETYDLRADTQDQVYVGLFGEAKDAALREVIAATEGEVLWFLGLYPTYYHSCCGGQTEEAKQVWGKREKTASVADPFCARSPNFEWHLQMNSNQLFSALKEQGLTGQTLLKIEIEKEENNPRNQLVILTTDSAILYLKATDFRRILGNDKIKSTWFSVAPAKGGFQFSGYGYGHGVGLCQWGARAMALEGKTYREILEHFYPKAEVRKIY